MFDYCTCRRTGAAIVFSTAFALGACGGGLEHVWVVSP